MTLMKMVVGSMSIELPGALENPSVFAAQMSFFTVLAIMLVVFVCFQSKLSSSMLSTSLMPSERSANRPAAAVVALDRVCSDCTIASHLHKDNVQTLSISHFLLVALVLGHGPWTSSQSMSIDILTILVAAIALVDGQPLVRSEHRALMSVYSASGCSNFNMCPRFTEGSPCPPSNSQFLTCTNGSVTSLSLSRALLTGSIATQIGSLTALREVRFDVNQLRGSLPSDLSKLTAITALIFNNNLLSGTIPSDIHVLSTLTRLFLNNNALSGTIHCQIGMLSSLEALFLDGNQLSGSIPSQIGQLTNLNDLIANNNLLTGFIPTELSLLTKLLTIRFGSNFLIGTIPPLVSGRECNLIGNCLNCFGRPSRCTCTLRVGCAPTTTTTTTTITTSTTTMVPTTTEEPTTTATNETLSSTSTLHEASLMPPSQLEMTSAGTMSDVGSSEPATLVFSTVTVDLSVTRSTAGGSLSSDPSTTLTIIIACAVAGAVLVIAAAVGLTVWLVRRRRRVAGTSSGGTPGMDMPVIATPAAAASTSTSIQSINYGVLPPDPRPSYATYASSADFPRSTTSSGHYDVLSDAEAAEKLQ
jgi:Leucine-rich repeat (LRR) protein